MPRQTAILSNGRRLLRGVGPRASCPRPWSRPTPKHTPHSFSAHTTTNRGQQEAQHEPQHEAQAQSSTIILEKLMKFKHDVESASSKRAFKKSFLYYIYISMGVQSIVWLLHEPLKDSGLVDTIADRTVGSVLPPETVEPPNAADDTLYKTITRDKEIRLLVLEPGVPGDEIECHLIHVEQSWRTKYEALSYAWGDGANTRRLTCSGRTVDVQATLHDALSDLRHPTEKRTLWVDALCINQADTNEKEKQVALMADIYSQARQVLIYLGKSDSSVEKALDSINRLDRKFMLSYLMKPGSIKRFWFSVMMRPMKEGQVSWDHILNLLNRPWFRRTWVIQETVLARRCEVFCGNQSISWVKFQRVVTGMSLYHVKTDTIPGWMSTVDARRSIQLIANTRRQRHRGIVMPDTWLLFSLLKGRPFEYARYDPKLLDLILGSRSLLCTNPSDKVFGMLGMTDQDTGSEYVKPNYSLSSADVFRKFVLWDILHNGSLRVLGASSDKAGSQCSSPSWVPDFSRLDNHHILTYGQASFDASGGASQQAWTSDQETVLHLNGKIVDTLHTVGERSPRPMTPLLDEERQLYSTQHWASRMQSNKDMVEEAIDIWRAAVGRSTQTLGSIPETSEIMALREKAIGNPAYVPSSVREVIAPAYVPPNWKPFLQTLVCDRTHYGRRTDDRFLGWVASFVRLSLQGSQIPEWYVAMHHSDAFLAIEAFRSTNSRRFAGTDTGLIGFVPMRAKKGDLVCILYGAEVPFVLRRMSDGRYSLVGECYMNGIMYGETLKTAEVKDEDVVFAIV